MKPSTSQANLASETGRRPHPIVRCWRAVRGAAVKVCGVWGAECGVWEWGPGVRKSTAGRPELLPHGAPCAVTLHWLGAPPLAARRGGGRATVDAVAVDGRAVQLMAVRAWGWFGASSEAAGARGGSRFSRTYASASSPGNQRRERSLSTVTALLDTRTTDKVENYGLRQKGLRRHQAARLGSPHQPNPQPPSPRCKKTSLGDMADDMGDAWDDDEFEVSRHHNSHLTKQRPFRPIATLYRLPPIQFNSAPSSPVAALTHSLTSATVPGSRRVWKRRPRHDTTRHDPHPYAPLLPPFHHLHQTTCPTGRRWPAGQAGGRTSERPPPPHHAHHAVDVRHDARAHADR